MKLQISEEVPHTMAMIRGADFRQLRHPDLQNDMNYCDYEVDLV